MASVYENAIRNTAERLNRDPDAFARECEDGELLHRLISAALNSARMLEIEADTHRLNGELSKAEPNIGQAEMTYGLVGRLTNLPHGTKAA